LFILKNRSDDMKKYQEFSVFSQELNREIKIFMMLPKSYNEGDKSYPVLYMNDGINLFDDNLATYGKSWGIIEAFENNPDLTELIIVGIDNEGEYRSNDLVPFTFKFSDSEVLYGGNTDNYIAFITKTLKPIIDTKYRTLINPLNTGIMGSSFGGVCATYAALKYTEYFSKFGCVSNAYYVIQNQLENFAKSNNLKGVNKFYMDVGTKETSNDIDNQKYIDSNKKMYNILKDKIDHKNIKFVIAKDAIHNEIDWEKRFPDIINFLYN